MAVIAGAIAIAAIGFVLVVGGGNGAVAIDGAASFTPADASGGLAPLSGLVAVSVSGAVARPGLYRLPAGARVGDLLEAAGGYGPRIDTSAAATVLDLAAPLRDGEGIHVPSRDDAAAAASRPLDTGGGAGLIDLNTATAEQLDTLPGVGPATAEKIIAAREEAPFTAVDELRSRGVLGEKTFDGLRDLITVD